MNHSNQISDNPEVRNPLKFEDVAYGAHVRWCVAEKSALKFFKATFQKPREAAKCLRENNYPPDAFWESL